jgi:hypothetical protein
MSYLNMTKEERFRFLQNEMSYVCWIETQERIEAGKLPKELNDMDIK